MVIPCRTTPAHSGQCLGHLPRIPVRLLPSSEGCGPGAPVQGAGLRYMDLKTRSFKQDSPKIGQHTTSAPPHVRNLSDRCSPAGSQQPSTSPTLCAPACCGGARTGQGRAPAAGGECGKEERKGQASMDGLQPGCPWLKDASSGSPQGSPTSPHQAVAPTSAVFTGMRSTGCTVSHTKRLLDQCG